MILSNTWKYPGACETSMACAPQHFPCANMNLSVNDVHFFITTYPCVL